MLQDYGIIKHGSCSSSNIRDPETEAEDRLSSLPDDVLVIILSFLTINSAATTSVLSRRWHHLWTHTTNILIHFPNTAYAKSVVTTVDHIISQLKSHIFHTFDLRLSFFLPFKPVSRLFPSPRIDQICARGLQVVNVNVEGVHTIYTEPYMVPYCLFQTRSLVQLQLHANLHFGFPYNTLPFTFPNLKKLGLDLRDPHIALISKNGPLFTACPLLEDLTLNLYFTDVEVDGEDENYHIVDISTPNLKYLTLSVMAIGLDDWKFVVNAPMLQVFYVSGDLAFYEFVTNPIYLEEAAISISETSFGRGKDYINKIPGLFQGISCVRNLFLQESAIYLLYHIIVDMDVSVFPSFHNLIFLSISYNVVKSCWIGKLPGCFFLDNLTRVDIVDVECKDSDIHLMQYILSNAKVLDELLVFVYDGTSITKYQSDKEYKFCKKLFKLLKSSVNCRQIVFTGVAIIASNAGCRDGRGKFIFNHDHVSDDTDYTFDSELHQTKPSYSVWKYY